MNSNTTTMTHAVGIGLVALVTAISSCSEPATQNTTEPKPAVTTERQEGDKISEEVKKMQDEYEKNIGSKHPYVGAKEHYCLASDFFNNIHQAPAAAPNNHAPIRSFPQESTILATEITRYRNAAAATPCAAPGPVDVGVVVHFGMDVDNDLVYALQFPCLIWNSGTGEYTIPNPQAADVFFTIGAGGMLFPTTLAAWQPNIDRYKASIRTRRNDATWDGYLAATTHTSEVFPYRFELEDLIAQNPVAQLQLVPISTPETRTPQADGTYVETNWQLFVSWVPVGVKLDDANNGTNLFKNRAADLGSPCPPNCPMQSFRFKTIGTEPRSSCK